MAVGSSNSFDLVVLGGGTGGYSAAFRAGQLGLRVALVDEQPKIGGTCLHWGCIPTKAMLESAELYERVRRARDYGVNVDGATFDYGVVAKRRQQVVDRLAKGLSSLVKKNKVEYIRGRGTLHGGKKIKVAKISDDGGPDGEITLDATDVILATGSRVKSLPGLTPDGARIVTSDEVATGNTLPKSIVIVGAGAVGVEFASFFHDAGVEVTLLEYLPTVTPLEDADISKELERSFTRRGIKVMTNARFDPASVVSDEQGVCVMVGREGEEQKELRAEQMLVATGRAPNSDNVGLESTRAKSEKGFVQVDARLRTAEPHLYAIGDVIGGLLLAHVAAHEGIAAVHAIAGAESEKVDYLKMPRATYSRPQVASIGRTQAECERDGLRVKTGKFPFQASGKALISGEHEGFVKVVAHAETDEILGVHMIGPHVTDLISEASAAMLLEATSWEVGAAVHPHPTLSEALGEAALAVDGKSINF
ncbi:MAG TPA: dihydrolipoyl dehydrogenase [Candidatus Caenarcaniphilales bacterium]|nr:dihydrolipoyl dehydrogenase [Candidatus Caenarcaniphilales bacterium]